MKKNIVVLVLSAVAISVTVFLFSYCRIQVMPVNVKEKDISMRAVFISYIEYMKYFDEKGVFMSLVCPFDECAFPDGTHCVLDDAECPYLVSLPDCDDCEHFSDQPCVECFLLHPERKIKAEGE